MNPFDTFDVKPTDNGAVPEVGEAEKADGAGGVSHDSTMPQLVVGS
jgi:hypothetical protein